MERYDPLSSSYILENTLEEETINELEKEALNEYKRIFKLLKTEDVDSYRIQLHRLEKEKPLQDIIERKRKIELEKTMSEYRQRQEQATMELLAQAQKRRDEAREKRIKQEEAIAKAKAEAEKESRQETENKDSFMKKLLKFLYENILWLILIIVTISTVPVLIHLPSEHWIRRLILAPFGVLGGYTIFLGAIKMAEQFEDSIREGWKLTLIFVISIFGAFILFYQFL